LKLETCLRNASKNTMDERKGEGGEREGACDPCNTKKENSKLDREEDIELE
jgi:hypothetical protein